ncbi:hypothetical protein [Streptomyces mirabilis]|uniref:hypothetical protein n=1 Tax=Streptomyces mirabilis TaxID=68239 RepID=UPI0033239386
MAELVRKQHIDADVGYNAFGLQESDDADLPVPFPDDFDYDTFLSTHPGRLDITSGGHTTLPPSWSKCGTARCPNKTQPIETSRPKPTSNRPAARWRCGL